MGSNWWKVAYPGAPMVAVKGFPRPLYPPDVNSGHMPSSDGSDVEAYKRTISRAGRWKWQAFDQAYSNGFAHGRSGNVGETGVAGVQRQQKVQPTGWIGRETFNLLRSVVIPVGLAHAGEHAMDARSVELINMAWDRFGGEEKPEPDAGSSAKARLAKATTYLNVKESPPNSNICSPFTPWYPMQGPWCAVFVTYCDQTSGRASKSFSKGTYYMYVPYIVNDARAGRRGLSVTSSPQPGDIVCFDWSWDSEFDHVGIVQSEPDANGDFTTIEGNTSPDNEGDQSNGGQVCRRYRNRYTQGTVFVRVQEP